MLTDLTNGNPNTTSAHNHVRDQGRFDTTKVREEMKSLAESTIAGPSAIQSGILLNARIGMKVCSRAMARARKKSLPPNPTTLNQLMIQDGFATMGDLNPVRFLLHDNCPGNAINSRIVIFATDDNLRRLAAGDRWYADGNFKLVPGIFKQLYIVRIKLGETYITVIYCYLKNKSQVAYREMWRIIQHECQQRKFVINVAHLVVDFEIAVINSFHFIFGNHVQVHGCFFHLTQSTWWQIQDLGLTQTYINNDQDFQLFTGMIDALAFLPVNDVILGMAFLRQNMPHPRAVELVEYFDRTYVNGVINVQHGAPNPPARLPPMFALALWNVHTATLNENARTNNVCESWNNAFFHIVGHHHPSMWNSVAALQKQNSEDENFILQDSLGQ